MRSIAKDPILKETNKEYSFTFRAIYVMHIKQILRERARRYEVFDTNYITYCDTLWHYRIQYNTYQYFNLKRCISIFYYVENYCNSIFSYFHIHLLHFWKTFPIVFHLILDITLLLDIFTSVNNSFLMVLLLLML